jgi:hypothetical protein
MKKVLSLSILLTVPLVIGLGAGYAAGLYSEFYSGINRHQILDSDHIELDIELLSFLRMGEVDEALYWLERDMDRMVIALAQGRSFSDLPAEARRSLLMARVYHGLFPSRGRYAAKLEKILKDVPEPSTDFYRACGEGLKQLIRRSPDQQGRRETGRFRR